MMEWLLQRIRSACEANGYAGTWLCLVEDLLHCCRDRHTEFDAALAADGAMAEQFVEDLEREATALLHDTGSALVHPTLGNELIALLRQHADRWPSPAAEVEVLACRAVALAIDEALHEVLHERFQDRGQIELEPGDAHPVHRYDLLRPTRLIADSPNSRPENLTLDLTVLPHLRLAGEHAGDFRYILDWDAYGRLAPLAHVEGFTIAACQPNVSPGEFDADFSDEPPSPSFRNHGPTPQGHGEVLLAQLEASIEAGAHVVVFPEYTVGLADREQLLARLDALANDDRAHSPVLVVAGTSEVPVAGEAVQNQACLWMPRGGPVTLAKCIPATLGDHVEGIDPGDRTVKVFMTERWAVAVLICRDAFEPRIVRQLEDVGVNLLLVPAMTPKTGSLVTSVASMPARSQAFVVVAVAPATWPSADNEPSVQASFQGPYEHHPGPLARPASDETAAVRSVWVFEAFERAITRINVPEEG